MTQGEIKRLKDLRRAIEGVHFYEFVGRYDLHDSMPRSKETYAVYSTVEKHLVDALKLLNEVLEEQQP
jgi:hypothetical protein